MGELMNRIKHYPPQVPLQMYRKFIAYARSRCGPRLSAEAGDKLQNRYVLMRGGTREAETNADRRLAIPITVRWVS